VGLFSEYVLAASTAQVHKKTAGTAWLGCLRCGVWRFAATDQV